MERSPQGTLLGSQGPYVPRSSQVSSLWLCGAALGDSPEHPGHCSTAGPEAAAPTKGCSEHRPISSAFSNGNATADMLRALAPPKQKGAARLLGEQGKLPSPCT